MQRFTELNICNMLSSDSQDGIEILVKILISRTLPGKDMARPSILPLPDDQARAILDGVAKLDLLLLPNISNRAYLERFIPIVHQATGRTFGASILRRLLKQFAPGRSPATPTIQKTIQRYRALVTLPREPDSRLNETASATVPTKRGATRKEPEFGLDEIGALMRLELDRARARADTMQKRAEIAEHLSEQSRLETCAAQTKVEALESTVVRLQGTIDSLTTALQLSVDRAAADNRLALHKVDEIRQETRAVQEQLQQAQLTIASKNAALIQAQVFADSLRAQLARLKQVRFEAGEGGA